MNPDFADMLSALSAAGVEFLIVGAHALAAHGVPRATGDLGIWVRPTPDNAARTLQAWPRSAHRFPICRSTISPGPTPCFKWGCRRPASTSCRVSPV